MFKTGTKLRIGAVVLEDIGKALSASGVDKVFIVKNAQEALSVINEVIAKKEIDLLLVDDVIVSLIGKSKLVEIKYKHPFPAIVELETNRVSKPVNS
ncbi:MAG: V-type ATP synthase subunit F [Infirmifilum sp.]